MSSGVILFNKWVLDTKNFSMSKGYKRDIKV